MDFNQLNEKEKGYLFGLFEGDGYKHHDKKCRRYSIEFHLNSLKDVDIIQYLTDLLKKIGLNPSIYQDKRYNCKRIRVLSKEFFPILLKNNELKDKSNHFGLGFVSGLIDSEAWVNKQKSTIMIVNTNKKVLDECQLFLRKINIYSYISLRKPSLKEKLPSFRMYISVKFKKLGHLSVKANQL